MHLIREENEKSITKHLLLSGLLEPRTAEALLCSATIPLFPQQHHPPRGSPLVSTVSLSPCVGLQRLKKAALSQTICSFAHSSTQGSSSPASMSWSIFDPVHMLCKLVKSCPQQRGTKRLTANEQVIALPELIFHIKIGQIIGHAELTRSWHKTIWCQYSWHISRHHLLCCSTIRNDFVVEFEEEVCTQWILCYCGFNEHSKSHTHKMVNKIPGSIFMWKIV